METVKARWSGHFYAEPVVPIRMESQICVISMQTLIKLLYSYGEGLCSLFVTYTGQFKKSDIYISIYFTLSDFFLWGDVVDTVYRPPLSHDLQELRQRIIAVVTAIEEDLLE
jgi:hypothetical protein